MFRELVYDGINVDVIHSERTKAQRDAIVSKFRTGQIWVLISTELMARGLDFKGVSLVINYDFPQTVQSYIHRIGRTGRAGRAGESVTYFTNDDAPYLKTYVECFLFFVFLCVCGVCVLRPMIMISHNYIFLKDCQCDERVGLRCPGVDAVSEEHKV